MDEGSAGDDCTETGGVAGEERAGKAGAGAGAAELRSIEILVIVNVIAVR